MEELKYQMYMVTFESFICGALFMVMIFHYASPKKTKKTDETDVLKNLKLYCFHCEIQMPVKEENGSLCCSKCGLHHGKFE